MAANTIEEVVARLRSMQESLPVSDGVRWFNRLYLDVTVAVRTYCRSGKLQAPPFLEDLDVLFGNQYFDVFDAAAAGRDVPQCWAPLFDARHDPHIAPLQFALAGLNAHVNHDLALGVVHMCEQLSVQPADGTPQHADFTAVNSIMGQTEAQEKQWLLTGAVKELDHAVAPVDDAAVLWSLEQARNAARVRAKVIWHLRHHAEVCGAYLAALDASVGMSSRLLLLVRGLTGPPAPR
jgi:hypothetical protein